MKTLQRIIINLILVLTITILTSGCVFAANSIGGPLGLSFETREDLEDGETITIIKFTSGFREIWGSTTNKDGNRIGNYGSIKVKAKDGSGEVVITFVDFDKDGKALNRIEKENDLDAIIVDNTGVITLDGDIKFDVEVTVLNTETFEYTTKTFSDFGGNEIVINESAFSATIKNDELKYRLVFTKDFSDLIDENLGYSFYIKFPSLGNKKLSIYNGRVGNSIDFPSGWKLHEYAGQTINAQILSDQTTLNKSISLFVPKAMEETDITAEIVSVGTIGFKNDGNATSTNNVLTSLGLSLSEKISLYYQGASNPTATSGANATSQVQYTDFLQLRRDMPNVLNPSADFLNAFEWVPDKLQDYFKAVAKSGDLPLSIKIKNVTISIEHPSTTYFEAITGISMQELQAIVNDIQDYEDENTEHLTGNTIIIPANSYKEFTVPSSANYYVYKKVQNSSEFGAIVPVYAAGRNAKKPLARAGVLTGEVKEDKPLGEYIYFNGKSPITFGVNYGAANCYPLVAGARYRIVNETKFTMTVVFHAVGGEVTEICDESLGDSVQLQSEIGTQLQVGYIFTPEYDFFKPLEELLARFIRTLANGLTYLVHMSLQAVSGGESNAVDIDAILFNHYPDTTVNFFTNAKSQTDGSSQIVERFRDGVNHWYGVFQAIAIGGYLVILLYVGVKILFSTASKNQGRYKELLQHWAVGILILGFFPYVIKYAIDINNLLVKKIEDSKMEVLEVTDYSTTVDTSDFKLPIIMLDEEEYRGFAAMMDKNPYSGGNSYMAVMAARAEASEGLVDAVVYLIMVWQFIMIIIIYYKRVFMIAFLIVIFPWIALSYAIDKVGDGKSQAFDLWTKEIMVNIFIQSIHALVYVFVIGATYSSGSYSGDWLLTIMGISFLFQGEQILKQIIGLGSGKTITSLGGVAKRTIATVTAAKVLTRNVADNVVGAKSHLGKTVNYYRQWKTEEKTARNMDFLTNHREIPKGRELFKDKDGNDISHEFSSEDYHDLADAIQVVNNRDAVTDPQMLAEALETVMKNKGSLDPKVQSLMKGLNLSDEQLQELSNLQQDVVDKLVDGDKSTDTKYSDLKESIDQDIELRLQAIFPADRERRDLVKRAIYFRLRDGNRDEKHKIRSIDRLDVKREMDMAVDRRNEFLDNAQLSRNGVSNPFSDQARATSLSDSAKNMRTSVLSTHFKLQDGRYKSEDKEMAENIAILKDFSNQGSTDKEGHAYTPAQTWKAAKYLAAHQNDSKENKRAIQATLGVSGEEVKAIIAEEIGRRYTDVSGDRRQFRMDIENGAGAKINPIARTEMERNIAVANTKNVWDEVIEYISENDRKAGERLCYDESLDKIDIKDALRRERSLKDSEDERIAYDNAYADYIVSERTMRNEEEIIMVENFAREQLDDLPGVSAVTYNGLTKEQHEQYSKDLRNKFVEELGRTSTTTMGVVLGGSIGTGLAIGLSDDESVLNEALVGASAGALAGDYLAEQAFGREDNVREVEVINPYTGIAEKVELRKSGLTREGSGLELIGKNEVVDVNDSRLAGFKYDLDRRFLESKQKQEKKNELERRKSLYDDALRRNLHKYDE